MLRQQARQLVARTVAIDSFAVLAGFLLGYWIRALALPAALPKHFALPIFDLATYAWMCLVLLPVYIAMLATFNTYRPGRLSTFRRMPVDIAKAAVAAILLLIGLTYIVKVQDVSRSMVLIVGLTTYISVIGGRLALRGSVQGQRDYTITSVLIVGTGEKAQNFAALIERNRKWGFRLVGLLSEHRSANYPRSVGSFDVIGNLDDLEWICKRHVVDEVIVVVPGKQLSDMEDLFLLCEELGINARVAVGIFPHLIARATLEEFSHIPLLTFTTKPTNWAALAAKRCVDLLIAWPALVIGLPFWTIIAILIKVDSSGPIFYCQERCGLSGRRFTMYKFRSMVADADARKGDVVEMNELSGPVFKIRKDPRITRVGRILRKTSLDEIPQLLNVIKGDMSIVGPRPAIPSEVDKYERWQRRRLSMKPGLTSLWVIRGRNNIPFEQWMHFDLEYIDNWSLSLDLIILLKTVPVVLTARGAS